MENCPESVMSRLFAQSMTANSLQKNRLAVIESAAGLRCYQSAAVKLPNNQR